MRPNSEGDVFCLFSLMAALLGNHVLTESDLSSFHARLIPKLDNKVGTECPALLNSALLGGLIFFLEICYCRVEINGLESMRSYLYLWLESIVGFSLSEEP
jgi:hypothetical protein